MQEYAISVGRSRTEKKWKTKQTTLEAFIQRLGDPVVTAETMAEYAAYSKDDRDARKDVGGYVAAALKDSRRANGCVQWRSMVTLDLDNVDASEADALELIAARCPYYYVVHPTHSHRPETPRLRLIVPLEAAVTEEQYEPIARRVAADINMDWFDPTTFQATRLMYWPSVPCDLDYDAVFTVHEGPLCVGADMLARYTDWKNIGEWPVTSNEIKLEEHRAKTQQDPREKNNEVGVFCRAYTIQEAIETFLPDVYTSTDKPNRYTYAAGSTVGGLVLYDDIFAYDNHATSPASGQLCNAFDLVRIHKFGEEDARSRVKDPTKLPSYKAMLELMERDDRIQKQKAHDLTEKQKSVESEFEFETPPDQDDSWKDLLVYDKAGLPAKLINNVYLILTHDPAFKGKLYTDTFAARDVLEDSLPWSRKYEDKGEDGKPKKHYRDWSDADTAQLRRYLEVYYNGLTNKDVVETGLTNAFQAQSRHPVREYLESLPEWDGTERVDTLLVDYLGAEDSKYVRTITRTHLVAAVARVMEPGIKYDTMITLCGSQGAHKSSFIRILCGDDWFNDSLKSFNGDKDAFMLIQGSWMIEVGELVAYGRSKTEEFKSFLSKTTDIYRAPYGHRTGRQPRQCIFWGTTNGVQFLKDPTGERRMWPVDVSGKDGKTRTKNVFESLADERDQIWAEALAYYRDDWPLFLSDDMERTAEEMRTAFMEEDDRRDSIVAFLEKDITDNWEDMDLSDRRDWLSGDESIFSAGNPVKRTKVTAFEIWVECFSKNVNEPFPKVENNFITDVMNSLPDWETIRRPTRLDHKVYDGKQKRVYFIRK